MDASHAARWRFAVCVIGLVVVLLGWIVAGCPPSHVSGDDVVGDLDSRADVDAPGDGTDSSVPDADISPGADGDVEAEGGDAVDTVLPPDSLVESVESWDVSGLDVEVPDCPASVNECYVPLADGGVACELPESLPYAESCEVSFQVHNVYRIPRDWDETGEPFPGVLVARDGSEAVVAASWRDRLANPGLCAGHCSTTILSPFYLLHLPTGLILAATFVPASPLPIPTVDPTCEVEGTTPEGDPVGRCFLDFSEFDIRYSWRMERIQLPFTYEGRVMPGALSRQRVSTGEGMSAVDLPIL